MLAYLKGFIVFMKALPDLVKIAKELLAYLHEVVDHFERWQKTKELKDAIKEARENRDTKKLEDLFRSRPPGQP